MVAGAGIPPQAVGRVIGVCKAYTTAVGTGPFPAELAGEEGDRLRERGAEYGATTGRPRRCGWLDMVALQWAVEVAGFTELALTKLDVLSGTPKISMCTGYLDGQEPVGSMPLTEELQRVAPVYEDLPGWEEDLSEVRSFEALPAAARAYVLEVERRAGCRSPWSPSARSSDRSSGGRTAGCRRCWPGG
jgi:adenylosuccinate synthase